ncbi:hypothetical protein COR50_17350 [Chitinophaga caeni]|uniref:DUF4595 domain-containing protein n=1 Tax=Chitinophaga caeni TaxID=2029983 RepID=A0A291QXT3_9BACT|nr:hypothetical protein COR50_17350 [Chitinophaga caeni]
MRVSLFASACVMLAGALLSGCLKDPHLPPPGNPFCKITKVKGDLHFQKDVDSYRITYDKKGNPESIVRGIVGTSSPNYLFLYDQKGRLTDFYGVYLNPTAFDIWHRYSYDAKNRIILDSTYEFGEVGPGNVPIPSPGRPYLGVRNIATYSYDHLDRIVRSTDTYGHDTVFMTRLYTYNGAGNLTSVEERSDGGSTTISYTYDNKVNYHRLHPIWQFLDRDYSMNNPLPVAAYNTYGLPTSIILSGYRTGYFATTPFTFAEFEYSCK